MLDHNSSLTAITLLLTILIFCRSVVLRRRAAEQSTLLALQTDTLEKIQNQLNRDEKDKNRELDFQTNLTLAEVTTDLQKSRSSLVHNSNTPRTPERYQYAQSMFQSGTHTDEISSALGMSKTEITQLLKLASITCKAEE